MIFIYFFQYETGRILKIFHFWGSYKFPLDLKLQLILFLYGSTNLCLVVEIHNWRVQKRFTVNAIDLIGVFIHNHFKSQHSA